MPLLVADGGRLRQKIAIRNTGGNADIVQCADNIVADRTMWRHRDVVPRDAIGIGFARQVGNHLRGRTSPQQEHPAQRFNVRLQRTKRLRQPPTRSTAQRSPLG